MVGEVVRYSDAVKAPQYLEAAVYPGKGVEALGDFLRGDSHLVGGGSGRQGVENVVPAGDRQLHPTQGLALLLDGEALPGALGVGDVHSPVVAALRKTEGNNRRMVQPLYGLPAVGVVPVDNEQAAGLGGELPERFDDVSRFLK